MKSLSREQTKKARSLKMLNFQQVLKALVRKSLLSLVVIASGQESVSLRAVMVPT